MKIYIKLSNKYKIIAYNYIINDNREEFRR